MIISFFKDEWSTYSPEDLMIETSWDDIAEQLTTFVQVETKEQTEMYNLWEFKVVDGQIHRCKEDCVALHGLVLDYDNNLTLNDALYRFCDFECVIYTTFNHGPNKDKFRVVLPFTRPLSVKEFSLKRKSMIEEFVGVDRASFSISQAIFLHSGPDASKAFSCRFKGVWLDPDAFEDEEIIEYVPVERKESPVDDEFKVAYRKALIDSLLSCRGFRHLNSLNIVIMLKSCGATFNDYLQIVQTAGDADSTIQDPRAQKEAWAAVPEDALIGRKKRDEFIAKFGGKPVKVNPPQEYAITRQVRMMKEKLMKRTR
jgi:hypothetical protein